MFIPRKLNLDEVHSNLNLKIMPLTNQFIGLFRTQSRFPSGYNNVTAVINMF